MNKNTLYLRCDCTCETLEFRYHPEERQLEISNWILSRDSRDLTLRARLRWMWHILWTGSPWSDQVILEHGQIKRIRDFMDGLLATKK